MRGHAAFRLTRFLVLHARACASACRLLGRSATPRASVVPATSAAARTSVMAAAAKGRALISLSDKTGLEALVKGLHDAGVEIISTGGTAAAIQAAGVPCTKVEDVTGFPEMLDGAHGAARLRRDARLRQ